MNLGHKKQVVDFLIDDQPKGGLGHGASGMRRVGEDKRSPLRVDMKPIDKFWSNRRGK